MKKKNPDASRDEHAAVLESRARALAQVVADENDKDATEVVLFRLAYETYGIETAHVREVYPLKDLTPLPCVPDFVAGIINVRGQVLSVIDLKKFFELPEQGLTDLNKVIVLSDKVMEFGVLADIVLETKKLPWDALQPAPPTLTGVREQYLKGISAERFIILDAIKLLKDKKLIVHEEVA